MARAGANVQNFAAQDRCRHFRDGGQQMLVLGLVFFVGSMALIHFWCSRYPGLAHLIAVVAGGAVTAWFLLQLTSPYLLPD